MRDVIFGLEGRGDVSRWQVCRRQAQPPESCAMESLRPGGARGDRHSAHRLFLAPLQGAGGLVLWSTGGGALGLWPDGLTPGYLLSGPPGREMNTRHTDSKAPL